MSTSAVDWTASGRARSSPISRNLREKRQRTHGPRDDVGTKQSHETDFENNLVNAHVERIHPEHVRRPKIAQPRPPSDVVRRVSIGAPHAGERHAGFESTRPKIAFDLSRAAPKVSSRLQEVHRLAGGTTGLIAIPGHGFEVPSSQLVALRNHPLFRDDRELSKHCERIHMVVDGSAQQCAGKALAEWNVSEAMDEEHTQASRLIPVGLFF